MATQTLAPRSTTSLPRAVLRADGAVVAAGGLLLVAAARPLGAALGLDSPAAPLVAGVAPLPYAVQLFRSANRRTVARRAVLAPALINTAWVLGSVAVLLSDAPALTAGARWAVAIVAAVVALFAVAQLYTLRQMR